MRAYLAGPMRGIRDFNFPAFHAATARLRAAGHEVFNPAEKDEEMHGPDISRSDTGNLNDIKGRGFDLRATLAMDLDWICRHAEAVVLLPGWENSKGARAEMYVAQALGLQVLMYEDMDL